MISFKKENCNSLVFDGGFLPLIIIGDFVLYVFRTMRIVIGKNASGYSYQRIACNMQHYY